MKFEELGGACWEFDCELREDGQCSLKVCSVVLSMIIEFMAQVDNPAISVVEHACELLGHPIDPNHGKKCYCRLKEDDA